MSIPRTPWLLFDYGEVLCVAPSDSDRLALENSVADFLSPTDLWVRYWEIRPRYDDGTLSIHDYWRLVLGKSLPETRIDDIHRHDIAMWSHPNPDTLRYVARAREAGYQLALLSNAPAPFGDAFNELEWLSPFSPRVFSGHVGLVKPSAAIYEVCLDHMNATPDEVTFIDDRTENIEAARALGMNALHFQSAAQLRELVE